MANDSVRETKLDLFMNRNSPLSVTITFEGKEYSIQGNGKGLKIFCAQGFKVEKTDIEQGDSLTIE